MTTRIPAWFSLPTAGLALLLVACGGGGASSSTGAASPSVVTPSVGATVQGSRAIGIRVRSDGVGELYNRTTQQPFVMRGYNYTHVKALGSACTLAGSVYHTTFNVGEYNAAEADAMLATLQRLGYNTVRVFLSPVCMLDSAGSLRMDYMAALADFLRLAKRYNQWVIITTDAIPSQRYASIKTEREIVWRNTQYLDAQEIALETTFWRDLVSALRAANAPLESILAYALRNEMTFQADYPPLNQSQGRITTANNQSYDMGQAADRLRMVSENTQHWANAVRTAIRDVDPSALVTVGYYAPEPVGKPSRAALFGSTLDFVDLHMYPKTGTIAEYANYFGLLERPLKPVVMGEFGVTTADGSSLAQTADKLVQWQLDSCSTGISGWLLWTWQTQTGALLSVRDDGTLLRALAPATRPDPCQR